MVDLVGANGATQRPPDKICPLAWSPVQAQGPAGLQLPNGGISFMAGSCVRERCGWWSEQHERCSMVSIGGLQSHLLEIADQASVAVTRMRPTVDELEDAGFTVTPPPGAQEDMEAAGYKFGEAMGKKLRELQAADPPVPFDAMLEQLKLVTSGKDGNAERASRGRERIADELRRLRQTLLGVYAAAAELLPGVWMDPEDAERTGRRVAGDERDEDKGGETPGEPG
jgi:hypothetical protein